MCNTLAYFSSSFRKPHATFLAKIYWKSNVFEPLNDVTLATVVAFTHLKLCRNLERKDVISFWLPVNRNPLCIIKKKKKG